MRTSSFLRVNSLVDEVDRLRFQLVGAVQVGQDEDLGGVFHRQTSAQSVLTHDLQSLQSILKESGVGGALTYLSSSLVFMWYLL